MERADAMPGSCGFPQNGDRLAVVACATVVEEMRPHLANGILIHTLDFRLHANPDNLKHTLSYAPVQKLIHGPWDADLVVAPPGRTIAYEDFRP